MGAAVKNRPQTPAPIENKPPTIVKETPAFLNKYREEDKGKGFSHKAEDSIVPFINLLAGKLCPELNPRQEKFIKGAEVGDIIVKGALQPLVKGNVGIEVIPCAFDKCWVEWVPRIKGGGFVTRHQDRPSDAQEKPNPENPNRTRWMRPNGNEVIETRYHYVLYNMAPYVIGFSSTGHTISREWTNLIKLLGGGNNAVSFERKYRLTTKLRTKMDQEWYVFSIADAGYVSEQEYLAGRAFESAIASGLKVADEDEREASPEGNGEI